MATAYQVILKKKTAQNGSSGALHATCLIQLHDAMSLRNVINKQTKEAHW